MAKPTPRNLAEFTAQFDYTERTIARIEAALAAMKAVGPEHWLYEREFTRLAGISQTQLGEQRERYKAHIVRTPHIHGTQPKNVWFADPKAAVKVRKAQPSDK